MTNKTQKKDIMTVLFFTFAALLLISAAVYVFVSKLEPKIERKVETVVVLRENGVYPDLMNTNEGTVVINFRAKEEDVNVGDAVPTKIQLFRSKNINGLGVYYMYEQKLLIAGLPVITSPPSTLLDGNMHQVAYTYKKDDRQMIYLDGNVIAESRYNPGSPDAISGFLVKQIQNEVDSDKGDSEYHVYSRVLSADEIMAQK
jgi:hypothetical protein